MNILAPVDDPDEVEPLVAAGADELYCGAVSREWLRRYTYAGINRRPSPACNFTSLDKLKRCCEIAHSYKTPVKLTINEHYYIEEQYPLLMDFIERCVACGVDGLIISDLALLLTLKKSNIKARVFMSTGCSTFSVQAARFFHSLGASGVTLDRHSTLQEIRSIVEGSGNIETVAFILNSRCPNVDGHCTFMHFPSSDPLYANACMLSYDTHLDGSGAQKDYSGELAACRKQRVWERIHMDDRPCGACALYEFKEMGIGSVKIVGRGYATKKKITDVIFVRKSMDLLGSVLSKEDFRDRTKKLYMTTYGRVCRAIMCYYPEVMG